MTPPFSAVSKKLWPSLCFRPPSPLLISDKSLMRIFPDPLYDQEGQLQGRPAETISTKVSGKVNLIFYKLNQVPIFLVDIKKYKKETENLSLVGSWRIFLLSQRQVSRNANSASICKFKSNPSILNRVVPQVLLHNLTK